MFLYRYGRQYVAGKGGAVNDRGTAAFYAVSMGIKMARCSSRDDTIDLLS